jgi:hypothetical protein
MKPLPSGGFVDRYVAGILYPPGRTGIAQGIAFTAAAISWVALARKHREAVRSDKTGARAVHKPSALRRHHD